MKTRLDEVLQGEEENYLLPFLWQRGEDEAVIREEMERVYDSGIRAVCVEARPHPDFLGPRWWQDIDIIMDEARRRGMRVWVLDDDHFPSGHAAGKMATAPAELHRLYLNEFHIDALGPQKGASLPFQPWCFQGFPPSVDQDSRLVAAVAVRRDAVGDTLTGELLDLTGRMQGDMLYWDIPEGYWRIFFLYSSPHGGSERHVDYVNPIQPASVRVYLDGVYEPFYAHYPEDFGQTFAGFFADEPGFYNDKEIFDYQSKPGKIGVALPWRTDLLELLNAEGGRDFRSLLPLLWENMGEASASVRYTYMNVVSRLYGECFTTQIGDWCRSHKVEYIGHVLEDNGIHARLGCGAGHYFRALWGQDMAGLDVVLWQLVPGFDQGTFTNISGQGDGEFYHYGLGKLGSSLAHIDPKKKGRTMCEVFGAYGWREGLKLMKWMTDHMLVRGVNYFVPHAFSQAEFPDSDCPPHMYARGHNPQYRYYRELNQYTNRLSHLLSGGVHVASAAVLYHAEAEWAGEYMPFQKPVRVLMQSQIDCDVLPGDVLLTSAVVTDSSLAVATETYPCLIVPSSEALPAKVLARMVDFADQGLYIIFVNRLPARSCEGFDVGAFLSRLAEHAKVHVVILAELAGLVKNLGFDEIETGDSQPYLRSYHVRHPGLDVFMFTNEHPHQTVKTTITFPVREPVLTYEAFANQVYQLEQDSKGIPIHLSPYESIVLVTGDKAQAHIAGAKNPISVKDLPGEQRIVGPWRVKTATSQQYPEFSDWKTITQLMNISSPDALPKFSGTFRYETEFDWGEAGKMVMLDLGDVYETAEVWLNGQRVGVRICPPYHFEIGGSLNSGKNQLVVEVTNTLVKAQADFFSRYAPQEPSGLIGPVRLLYEVDGRLPG